MEVEITIEELEDSNIYLSHQIHFLKGFLSNLTLHGLKSNPIYKIYFDKYNEAKKLLENNENLLYNAKDLEDW